MGRRLSEVSEFEYILIVDLGCGKTELAQQIGDSCNCYFFLQLIHRGMSLEEVEKMFKLEGKFFSLPLEEELRRYSAQTAQILSPSVQNQRILWASGSPFCELEAYRVDSLLVMDLNGGFSNKGFKSAPIGFYPKGEHTVFQKTKYMNCSNGGRAENIRPGRIRRLRRRRNKDDEEDGEDNRRPMDMFSDPGIKRTQMWASPKLKRSCYYLEAGVVFRP
ncbi:hypothetical protein Pint_22001 [Pistacia integerrima]|uniref:Uncharacterized protein n=1 Tax=Pistacia integerrima TaxID=434235 RepID=A0ACC0YLZ6_9ROSI|nr:hypothetical protein Pint_22001 [Pistacia integerrima]